MAEYLAPGVYVEETSFRSKSIEGVSTSTAAFVGAARRGPIDGTPELLTSETAFERIYGSPARLQIGSNALPNYLALAVKAFFDEGGKRLYVARVFEPNSDTDTGVAATTISGTGASAVQLQARAPGSGGNGRVIFAESGADVTGAALARLPVGTVIEIGGTTPSYAVRTAAGFSDNTGTPLSTAPSAGKALSVSVTMEDADGNVLSIQGLSYGSAHGRYLGAVLGTDAASRADDLHRPFALLVGADVDFGELRSALLSNDGTHALTGGNDGGEPDAGTFDGGLDRLEALDDISIVAAPGHSELSGADGIRAALITHVEKRGLYRVAVLDSGADDEPSDIRATRAGIDSDRAALYYPWVTIANPEASPGDASEPAEIDVPPSGFLCGIYARNDVERHVSKSPANEVLRSALRFARDVTFGENELLNPLGINCLRYFPGRGYRVWGARTASSDPEWKYLSVRRYFHYLEASIERGTQWAVFESNGPALWANVRETITSFLYNEWVNGGLLGDNEKQAFFVRCDRTTMTQNDLDNGRMVCLIGVAVVKPAEFVIFRIGQKTATARD